MCYYSEQVSTISEIKNRFGIAIENEENFLQSNFINGFSYPNIPIITNENAEIITTSYSWGVVPSWAKELDFRKNTLNARIETLEQKPSFKNIIQNRCLIIATGYYEWRWLDEKGKKKEKYKISSQDEEIFCFAGLYNKGVNPSNGDVLNTYTLITTEANELMKYVHNHKERMPIVLSKEDESAWLDPSNKIINFAYPYDAKIIAFPTT